MRPLSDFRYLVAPEVPGAASIVIDNAVLRTCRDFCDKTHIWRYEHPAVAMVSGTSDYTLTPPAETEVAWVNSATQGTHDVSPVGRDIAKKLYPAGRTGSVADSFYMLDSGTFRVLPTPTGNPQPITLDIALRPIMAATTIGAILFDEWGEYIAHGALSRLLAMPGKNWSEPNTAAFHIQRYKLGIAEAKRRDNYGRASFNDTVQAGYSFI